MRVGTAYNRAGVTWQTRIWTGMEKRILRRMWPDAKKKDILVALPDRTWSQIKNQAFKMRISRISRGDQGYTEREQEILRKHFAAETPELIMSHLPGRNWERVRHYAVETLKLKRNFGRTYSPREIEILRRHFATIPRAEILRLLPERTWKRIIDFAHRIGLKREFRENKYDPGLIMKAIDYIERFERITSGEQEVSREDYAFIERCASPGFKEETNSYVGKIPNILFIKLANIRSLRAPRLLKLLK